MDVFEFRDRIVADYERFTRSFTAIAAPDIRNFVDRTYAEQHYWPAPLIQLNPSFVPGKTVEDLVSDGVLEPECSRIFRLGKGLDRVGETLVLHRHQEQAVRIAQAGRSYVLTTGTGSGKSLSYFIPIVDRVLKLKKADPRRQPSISAIAIYPMNALCNSQMDELGRFLKEGYQEKGEPVRFARYTGQESQEERDEIARSPPDILLTNYMMLELILTRQNETDKTVVRTAKGLRFLVLDELHTYRGRQGADVALLVRRVREALNPNVLSVGTSATMVSQSDTGDRRRIVAEIASRLFGTKVDPANVVTEALQRVTSGQDQPSAEALHKSICGGVPAGASFAELQRHPVSAWIELNLGLEREDDKWVRTRTPMNLAQAARKLAVDSGAKEADCASFLRGYLLLAYSTRDQSGGSLFAFRLHQFVAGGGDVFGTLEPEGVRYLTLDGQTYEPDANREKLLFNFCFCRECGQEYAPVWATVDKRIIKRIEPRELFDRSSEDDDVRFGFFMPDPAARFDLENVEDSFPEDWLQYDDRGVKLKPAYRKRAPVATRVNPLGVADDGGMAGWLIPGSFRFCLNPECGAYYDSSVRSDLTKLAGLTTEGRSSATTVLTLASLRYLLEDSATLSERAKKVLGFTDNRQDASLQAGHFNDFVQVLLLRGALLAAIDDAPDKSLIDETLTQRVFDQLHLADADFSANPNQKGVAADNTRRALRDVLGYRLYFDLRRGWRITNPNLEQLGLLAIDYLSLDECCADREVWSDAPDLLANAIPETRKHAARLVLETLRRQLCVKTRYLDPLEQEQIKNRSHNNLREPWGLTEDEQLTASSGLIPEAAPRHWRGEFPVVFASFRSRLGRMLCRGKLWGGQSNPDLPKRFTPELYDAVIRHILSALQRYGIVENVEIAGLGEGYRVSGGALRWTLADDKTARTETAGLRLTDNVFFKTLYRNVAGALRADSRFLHRLEAREHTAQVDSDVREEREARFRTAALPVLFCSPTMELGVDIAELNVVYMRNLPPTPANYAQRSGRAGRSGQPALVVSYAAAKSPHDQYFFRNPVRMVAGSINPPALDLANEDLVRSHLHAVWLAETGEKLATSVSEVLDLTKEGDLPILDTIATTMNREAVRQRSIARGRAIMAMLEGELSPDLAPWHGPEWLERVANTAFRQFDDAFERWRTLFRATSQQMVRAQKIMNSAASSPKERDEAKRRHDDAYIQRKLLLDAKSTMNSDFYSYRYLASQGFLPGYNFPRLPLLAFIPARREKVSRDSFLSRPRFLALSEFGPRSIIYHEGSQYRVTKAILTITEQDLVTVEAKLPVREARLCPKCGYGHFGDQVDAERCASCNTVLEGGQYLKSLYRIENVSTRRIERITSDEEERQRQGFETLTTLQFAEKDGVLQANRIIFSADGAELLEAQYGPAATVWRINLGWRRRKEKSIYGFNIDVTTGLWAKDAQAPDDANSEGDSKTPPQRIIPFVEDRRNILIVRPRIALDLVGMATLQYALKRGVEREFQLEESELMVEPLPNYDERNSILLYEAAEGGAGVLTRLARDPEAIRRVATRALELCHFAPTGQSWVAEELTDTDTSCEAGCYRCLLSYYNQPDHSIIDRKKQEVMQLLCRLTHAEAEKGSEGRSAEDQFVELWRLSASSLEHAWLTLVREQRYYLPDRAQRLIEEHGTRPDFAYSKAQALVYVDGPHHDGDAQKRLDAAITERLEDAGYTVIRFGLDQDAWSAVFASYPDIFGRGSRA